MVRAVWTTAVCLVPACLSCLSACRTLSTESPEGPLAVAQAEEEEEADAGYIHPTGVARELTIVGTIRLHGRDGDFA